MREKRRGKPHGIARRFFCYACAGFSSIMHKKESTMIRQPSIQHKETGDET